MESPYFQFHFIIDGSGRTLPQRSKPQLSFCLFILLHIPHTHTLKPKQNKKNPYPNPSHPSDQKHQEPYIQLSLQLHHTHKLRETHEPIPVLIHISYHTPAVL